LVYGAKYLHTYTLEKRYKEMQKYDAVQNYGWWCKTEA